jgi:two-component system, sensor histidine kinase
MEKTRQINETGRNRLVGVAGKLRGPDEAYERSVEQHKGEVLGRCSILAMASHEVRQPLHAAALLVEQLKDRRNSADRRRIISGIENALAAMNALFNTLLDLSKLDSDVTIPTISEFPVQHLLNRIETTFAGMAHEKGLALRVVANSNWLRSDVVLLERILSNLVSNAVRYTSRGGIVVGCRRRDSGLYIEVWDTGVGIDASEQPKIFDEFYRVARDDAGLGLGLAIVERLCRVLGHSIKLQSAVGKGSKFAVVVPLASGRSPARPRLSIRSATAH